MSGATQQLVPEEAQPQVHQDLDIEKAVGEGKGVIQIMDTSGDTKLIWDPEDDAEVENAKQTFDNLKAKGYAIFRVSKDGSKGEQMTGFSRDAGRLIAARAMQGG